MNDRILEKNKKAIIEVNDYLFTMEIVDSLEKINDNGRYFSYIIDVTVNRKGDNKLITTILFKYSNSEYNYYQHGGNFRLHDFSHALSCYFNDGYLSFLYEDIDEMVVELGLTDNSVKKIIRKWVRMKEAFNNLSPIFAKEELGIISQELRER